MKEVPMTKATLWTVEEFSLRMSKVGHKMWSYVELYRGGEIMTYSSGLYSQVRRSVDSARKWASLYGVKLDEPDLSHVESWVIEAWLESERKRGL